MALDDEAIDLPPEEHEQFVPAVFARSAEEAEVYCELLNDHDIPAIVGDEDHHDQGQGGQEGEDDDEDLDRKVMTHGVPVLVPEALLDDAGEIIAVQEELDEFAPSKSDEPDDDEDEDDFGLSEIDGDFEDDADDFLDGDDVLDDED